MSDDIFDQDRGEAEQYKAVTNLQDELKLPLTKSGFEALLQVSCEWFNLPVDDASRAVLAGYIHHIPNETNTVTLSQIGRVLHKSIANSTSWRIDQDIKIKKREALKLASEQEAKVKNEEPVLGQPS